MRHALLPVLLAGAFGAAGPARAALFEDDEARKAILDLRARIQASDDAAKARMAELVAGQTQALEQLRRSLVELNTLIEAQRGELARLRGVQEQMQRDVAELQKRQREGVNVLEERLRKIEPQPVSVDGKDFLVEPEERRAYEEAVAVLRTGDFDKSAATLAAFIRRYPTSGYLDSARFWLGNALYGKRDYKEAIAVFRALVAAAPDHPRAAEALLAIANCQVEMKDVKAARRTLDDLLKSYPKSEAAAAGRERLGSLKG
ncbi:tol-pal system protein YbgF [Aquincola sp. S2]|uniref:Cell division coordinator CpoB n=1 Tax=Pseudaquabacterium terrae TaxID=2732868 RepID=A0ABX2EG25_9BURK|nr:tol-pal system protein YbgF [Aquabacterium terrae]NRF67543.1 tol-pal system protein YbgF [Aquabacterium terrae]